MSLDPRKPIFLRTPSGVPTSETKIGEDHFFRITAGSRLLFRFASSREVIGRVVLTQKFTFIVQDDVGRKLCLFKIALESVECAL